MGDARFGPYRLERLLGKGGMGQVWLARDEHGAQVALKLLPGESAADPGYRARFEREAELAAALRDPHLVPIHRHGEVDGRLYIEMAYVDGTDLAARLIAQSRLAPRVAVDILTQVASALDAAHGAGLIHRDVKPSNILVRPDGFAYLIDFGIARGIGQAGLTATGMAIGTWAYMAPERFSGVSDARTDIYSLACVLYECVTGRRPYGDTDPAQQMRGHLMADPVRPSTVNAAVPPALDLVIARGMAKQPEARHRTAGEFARAARAAIEPGAEAPAPRRMPPTAVLPDGPTARQVDPAPPRPNIAAAQPIPHEHGSVSAAGDDMPPPAVRTPSPTKVMPDPAPPPTRVETRYQPPPPVYRPYPPAPARAYPRGVPPVRPAARPAPPRRRKRGGVLSRVIGALVVIFLAPFAFAAGCFALIAAGTSSNSSDSTVARPPAVTDEQRPGESRNTPAPADTPVRDGKFEFTVTGVEYGVSRVGLQTARGSFLIVALNVRNISNEQKWFLPFGQKVIDSDGRVFEHDAAATAVQTVLKGARYSFDLQPGQSGSAQLVFDIPADATPSHLELHDFMLSDGVTVDL
ncbi:serine/threonine-protein kinase [Nocardia arizonensis]|uniref:serine/threonine-protein kinase n=1 Tax=Nocardia arizonensis TaxID=1141647 RepID=UPI0006D04023|nr:serine/threonine-protein kinase [Nocardia arizonensis]